MCGPFDETVDLFIQDERLKLLEQPMRLRHE